MDCCEEVVVELKDIKRLLEEIVRQKAMEEDLEIILESE